MDCILGQIQVSSRGLGDASMLELSGYTIHHEHTKRFGYESCVGGIKYKKWYGQISEFVC